MSSDQKEGPRGAGPKLFVSYSWTSPDHEAWVLNLATELRESGIDVILDKWDLKEGHDAHAFMEKMVTDSEIRKVILICDKAYADKTDGRSGGVGTEAQIISGEIYNKQAQDKFVAIVKERDENGKPYLPVYYRSRIYIDLSDPGTYSEQFDRLLRWVYDKPLYRKPELGQMPGFLAEAAGGAIILATSSRLRRAVDGLRNNREYAIPATAEYLNMLADELEKFRIDPQANPFDEAVVQSIESFLPYRNEAIEIFTNLATYVDTTRSGTLLHRFFERVIPYLDWPENVTTYRDWDFDNFRFVIHELFLHAVATLIRFERFESAAYLLSTRYYVPSQSRASRDPMVSFDSLRRGMKSLDFRNQRLQLRRLSVRADMLQQRSMGIGVEFRHLLQADFILFMRSQLDNQLGTGYWFPETLLHVRNHIGPFEVFARSRSTKYFDRVKILLGIANKNGLESVLQAFAEDSRRVPLWQYESFSPLHLLGFDRLATEP